MSYGHMSLQFLDPIEAQRFLDDCRRNGNRTAENYQDRVNANRCILAAEGWSPAPLPPVDRSPDALQKAKAARSTRRARTAKR